MHVKLSSGKMTGWHRFSHCKVAGHFVKECNIVYESACFHRRTQKPGVSVDQSLTALHVLADRWDLGSLNERMIRDRLVVGLHDATLSEALYGFADRASYSPGKGSHKESVQQQQCTLRGETLASPS